MRSLPDEMMLPPLAKFARLHVSSGDVDPAYPVLRWVVDGYDDGALIEEERKLWHVLLYAAFYNLASAQIAIEHHPVPGPLCNACNVLPTGVERRNLRGGKMAEHITALLTTANESGGIYPWLYRACDWPTPELRWQALRSIALPVWGNGRWATYKLAELCGEVLAWPLAAPDMGLDGASGPLAGLMLVYKVLWSDPEAQGRNLQTVLRAYPFEVDLPLQQIETVLCDWHAVITGRYYVGHDIDLMQEQLLAAEARHDRTFPALWEARAQSFAEKYLGEAPINGWGGVVAYRKRWFRDHGHILDRDQDIALNHPTLR